MITLRSSHSWARIGSPTVAATTGGASSARKPPTRVATAFATHAATAAIPSTALSRTIKGGFMASIAGGRRDRPARAGTPPGAGGGPRIAPAVRAGRCAPLALSGGSCVVCQPLAPACATPVPWHAARHGRERRAVGMASQSAGPRCRSPDRDPARPARVPGRPLPLSGPLERRRRDLAPERRPDGASGLLHGLLEGADELEFSAFARGPWRRAALAGAPRVRSAPPAYADRGWRPRRLPFDRGPFRHTFRAVDRGGPREARSSASTSAPRTRWSP